LINSHEKPGPISHAPRRTPKKVRRNHANSQEMAVDVSAQAMVVHVSGAGGHAPADGVMSKNIFIGA